MATIYIPIEVPDEEVVRFLNGRGVVPVLPQAVPTQPAAAPGFTRTESEFGYTVQPIEAPVDPWASPATTAAPTAGQYQPAYTPTAGAAPNTPPVTYQPGGNPRCAHGEMKFVPAGVSKGTGRAYGAFFGCPAPRGQTQCKSIKVGQ